MGDDRLDRAKELYERAVFGGETEALAVAQDELDAVEAELALARGRVLHARFLADREENPEELVLFERAADLYRQRGDARGEAEACFWVGCFHQVVRGDGAAALPAHAGSPDQARTLLAEAATEAEESGARGILRWIEAARAELTTVD